MQTLFILFFIVLIFLFLFGKHLEQKNQKNAKRNSLSPQSLSHEQMNELFQKKIENDPHNAYIWSEWGSTLFNKALDRKLTNEERLALIEEGNSKMLQARTFSPNNPEVLHSWPITLGYAASECLPPEKGRYLDMARGIAQKTLNNPTLENTDFFYSWAELLWSIYQDFSDEEGTRLLQEVDATLGKAMYSNEEAPEFSGLWATTLVDLAHLMPEGKRLSLLERAQKLLGKTGSEAEEYAAFDLRKNITQALDAEYLYAKKYSRPSHEEAVNILTNRASTPEKNELSSDSPHTKRTQALEATAKRMHPQATSPSPIHPNDSVNPDCYETRTEAVQKTKMPGDILPETSAEFSSSLEALHALTPESDRHPSLLASNQGVAEQSMSAPAPLPLYTPVEGKTAYSSPVFENSLRELPTYARPTHIQDKSAAGEEDKKDTTLSKDTTYTGYQPISYPHKK